MADARRRNGAILSRRFPDAGGYLPGAASVECAPLRGRYESLPEDIGDRYRMQRIGRVSDGRAAGAVRRRERIAEKQQLVAAACIDQFAPQRVARRKRFAHHETHARITELSS